MSASLSRQLIMGKLHSSGWPMKLIQRRTFENCNNLEEGDREVVITIFGSYVPTFAYSSSTLLFGAASQLHSV